MIKGVDYEFVLKVPGIAPNHPKLGKLSVKTDQYQTMTKGIARIPFLDDNGFLLGESHAIACYLADKYGWDDYYPKDRQARARVDEYLHWHHMFGPRIFAPFFGIGMRPDLGMGKSQIARSRKVGGEALQYFEKVLAEHDYLCGTGVTLADFAGKLGPFQSADMKTCMIGVHYNFVIDSFAKKTKQRSERLYRSCQSTPASSTSVFTSNSFQMLISVFAALWLLK